METLSTIKAYSEATNECLASNSVSQEDKKLMEDMRNFQKYSYYGTKALIVAGFYKLVDWKRPASILQREIPYAILAFGLCAAADYLTFRYAFSQTEKTLIKYTGFRDGVYVNPDKFQSMKKSFDRG